MTIRTQVKIIHCKVKQLAQRHGLSQGFQTMSLVAEQSHLNKELKGRDAMSTKVLSAKAIAMIAKSERYVVYANRTNAMEPPFMAPLTDPGQYSKVFTDIT